MEGAAGIAILVVLFAGILSYHAWLRRSVQPREFHTRRPEHEVRALFERKVAGLGWSLVDDDNPMVAQSPLLAGRRQQIALHITRQGDGLHLRIGVVRLWTKGLARVPYKAHTLRMRMKSFEKAVGSDRPVAATATGQPIPFGQPEQPLTIPTPELAASPAGGAAVLGPNPFTNPQPMVPTASALPPVLTPSAPATPYVPAVPAVPAAPYVPAVPAAPAFAATPPPYVPASAPTPAPAPIPSTGPGVPPPYRPPAPTAPTAPPPAPAAAEQWWITN